MSTLHDIIMMRKVHPLHRLQRDCTVVVAATILNFDAIFTFANCIAPELLATFIQEQIFYTTVNWPGTIPLLDTGFFVFNTPAFRSVVFPEFR